MFIYTRTRARVLQASLNNSSIGNDEQNIRALSQTIIRHRRQEKRKLTIQQERERERDRETQPTANFYRGKKGKASEVKPNQKRKKIRSGAIKENEMNRNRVSLLSLRKVIRVDHVAFSSSGYY